MVFKGSNPSYVALDKLLNLSVSQFPSSPKIKYTNIWGELGSGPGHNKHQSPSESPKWPAPPPPFSKNSTNTKDSPTLALHTFVQKECFLLSLAYS